MVLDLAQPFQQVYERLKDLAPPFQQVYERWKKGWYLLTL